MASWPCTEWIHDVFLNFRGDDTRKGFISHLYAALSNARINVFIDEKLLQKGTELGSEIVQAIRKSRTSVVVFSRNYASSRWCLDELVEIFKCRTTYGHRVVPVFYHVDPSEVRYQKGVFGEHLEALARKCLLRETLDLSRSWRSVLRDAANLNGWDARNFRSEGDLVKEIVQDIAGKIDMDLLHVTDFPVGLESRMKPVIDFIESQTSCIVGIWGMGGLGKTTMAKVMYNRINRKFSNKSFVDNIREVCKKDSRGLIDLQEGLLRDVQKTKVKIHSIAMGITMIQRRLSGEKNLIVLDDVTEFEQLIALCGNRRWNGVGSVIIITTRDVHILKALKVDYVYTLEEMDENQSLELFSYHAFGEPKPREDFNELARDVVAYCGGLPLALEVLGSYLCERVKKDWESVLSRLETIPYDKVQEKLKISFDGLCNHMEKEIFLDVCCFFIGKGRDYVTKILNGCGLCADIGITVLIERCLIKVEKNNKLEMHPLLRDMGREIICDSSRDEPAKRSRLWFQKDVLDVLTTKNIIGTEAVVGLALKLHFCSRDCFNACIFQEMKNLRLLQLDHVQLTGDYGYLSKKLRWVRWQGFPSNYIPNNFNLEGVIAMDLKHSKLILLWKTPQILPCLKILNLSYSKYLTETPDFSRLPSLEKLILKGCSNLRKVHESIGGLHNLLLINVNGCTSLSNLPRELYKLKSVETLNISGCSKIDKLEEDIEQMESLTTLIAKNTDVKQVPFSIVRLKSIGYISLCGYEGLSRNVFPSIIWSWMSPTMHPLSCIHSLSGTSSTPLVSINMQNNDLDNLGSMLSNLPNLRSVLVQCDTEFELFKQLGTILDDAYGVTFTKLEMTSDTSQLSNHYLKSYLIGIGSYKEVFNILNSSISKGLETNEFCDVSLPGDNIPHWLVRIGGGHSVYFTVPSDCSLKGMALCVIYSSNPEKEATECLISVLMVNYTKYTIQICKRDTVISFNNVDWKGMISHLGPGDKVEIFVIFSHTLVVKKTAVYLMLGESIDKKMVLSFMPKKNTFIKFIKKIVT